jgi:hypothetical protein
MLTDDILEPFQLAHDKSAGSPSYKCGDHRLVKQPPHASESSRLTTRIRYIKMIPICMQSNISRQPIACPDKTGRNGPAATTNVPFSGGNWPPAWTKFLKTDAGRLKAPRSSVGTPLAISAWEVSRVDMVRLLSSRWAIEACECGLYKDVRAGRKPLNHWGMAMTKGLGVHCAAPVNIVSPD